MYLLMFHLNSSLNHNLLILNIWFEPKAKIFTILYTRAEQGNKISGIKHWVRTWNHNFFILHIGVEHKFVYFVYLGLYVAFNTVQVISRRVVGRAEETSTYSSLGFCTVNCRPTASNYQLSHLRP